jgi:hypothetical protein
MTEASRFKKTLFWTLFVLFSSVAILRLVFATDDKLARLPDTPESAQAFICRQCQQVFSLTPRQRTELMTQGGRVVHQEMTVVRRVLLPCPACGAVELVVARACPICGRAYLGTDQDGHQHIMCPDCEAADRLRGERNRSR